ncbi:MAG: hypothetical protein IT475_11245 [Aquimonas sp.]|nr:hypothetical protein [Aquimonas sp.]
MSSPWVKPGSELVAHLVRPSATNGTAEWLVACRSIENGRWEAYVAYGKSGSRGAMKVLGVCDSETGARQLAMVAADEKRKDPRYVDVIGSDVIGSNVVTVQQANLSLTIVSDTLQAMPELVALPKVTSGMRKGQLHGARIVLREKGSVTEVTGVCEADNLGARMTLAIINHKLFPGNSSIALDDGVVQPPKEWAMAMKGLMNEETLQRGEAAGLLPKAIDFAAIAQDQGSVWALF